MRRIIIGGILGGLVLFVWSFVAHDVLPFGAAGLRTMSPAQEEAVVAAMHDAMNERAIYLFPGLDRSGKMTAAEQSAWRDKYAAGPAGIIAYNPHPATRGSAELIFPIIFAAELLCDVLAALVAAALISHVPSSFGFLKRTLLVGSLGLIMTLDVDGSYLNWYAFPASYTLAQLVDHGVGYCLAGLVITAFVGDRPHLPRVTSGGES